MHVFPEPGRTAQQCQHPPRVVMTVHDADDKRAAYCVLARKAIPGCTRCGLAPASSRGLGCPKQASMQSCRHSWDLHSPSYSFCPRAAGGSNGSSGPTGNAQGGTLPGTYTINVAGSPASISQPGGSSVTAHRTMTGVGEAASLSQTGTIVNETRAAP